MAITFKSYCCSVKLSARGSDKYTSQDFIHLKFEGHVQSRVDLMKPRKIGESKNLSVSRVVNGCKLGKLAITVMLR